MAILTTVIDGHPASIEYNYYNGHIQRVYIGNNSGVNILSIVHKEFIDKCSLEITKQSNQT